MTITAKQLKANQENARKGGVKTEAGKEIVKHNALKHGLLAKEIVITTGEGAENPNEFNGLLIDFQEQLKPVGSLEEMLVEKIVVAYWRLRRAYKYETGLIRSRTDHATYDFYKSKDWDGKVVNKSSEEIDKEIEEQKNKVAYWERDKKNLSSMLKAGAKLEEIYDWEENWDLLQDKFAGQLEIHTTYSDSEWVETPELVQILKEKLKMSDKDIWLQLIQLCEKKIEENRNKANEKIPELEAEKARNVLKLEVAKKLGNIPSKDELDRLLRYESTIERQLYKALNQLERIQRLRGGDVVPAPIQVDVDVNTGTE